MSDHDRDSSWSWSFMSRCAQVCNVTTSLTHLPLSEQPSAILKMKLYIMQKNICRHGYGRWSSDRRIFCKPLMQKACIQETNRVSTGRWSLQCQQTIFQLNHILNFDENPCALTYIASWKVFGFAKSALHLLCHISINDSVQWTSISECSSRLRVYLRVNLVERFSCTWLLAHHIGIT